MKTLIIIALVGIGSAVFLMNKEDSMETPSTATVQENGNTDEASSESQPTDENYNYGAPEKPSDWKVPRYVKVQHILISFNGAARGGELAKKKDRSQEEALVLAHDLVKRLRAGENMDVLVRAHTQDSAPGIYEMSFGRPTRRGVVAKKGMVKNFGDTSFALDVGEVGLADYDATRSPFGYHIIKRLK